MPNLKIVQPVEGASAPSQYVEKEKYIALARAFENVDLERTHWRRQAEQLQALIEQMKQCMKPYEGE